MKKQIYGSHNTPTSPLEREAMQRALYAEEDPVERAREMAIRAQLGASTEKLPRPDFPDAKLTWDNLFKK